MGDRITRLPQEDLVRAKGPRRASKRGSVPAFIPPELSSRPAKSSLLSWNSGEDNPDVDSAETAFDLRRQCLEQLFQNSPNALVLTDSSFHVQCVNDQFERIFGYGGSQLFGKVIDPLIIPPDRLAEAQWIEQCLRRGEHITLETQRLHHNGSLLDLSISTAPLIVNGRPAAYYALYHDISERKRAEALSSALCRIAEKATSTEDLQQFFAATHTVLDELMFARNFSIVLYDPESQLLTYPYFVDEKEPTPPPSKQGRGLIEYVLRTGEPLLCSPKDLRELQQSGEIKLRGLAPYHWLGVPLRVNHHAFGVLVLKTYSDAACLRDRDKEVLTLISRQLSAAIDHKRNEQLLRRSEHRYRSLVQTAVYGIYRSSNEGRFLDVNPALIGMLGYNSPLEVLALDPEKDIFADPAEYKRLTEEFRRTGRVDGFEVRWKCKDGRITTVRISGRAVASENEPSDVLEAIAEDITERRVLEDQFRQAQKMEAVGRLAGGIAHDFNNLLMVVSGYTEVLLDKTAPEDPLHAKIESIQQASDRATALTRQLLAFSRKQLLELKVIDVNAVVKDMERLLRPLIGENIELTTTLTPDVGCTRADAGQLEQVLMNLVVNAKDAMPNGGKICIRTASVNLDESYRPENTFIKRGPYVMISVSDNGHGMDRETQVRVFEPFFTTKEKGKGTGLGLSTVYGIIKQSGGYVFVQSELDRGTTFTIYFPRVDEQSEAIAASAPVAASGGTETILLVEDEESVRQLVRETLVSRGYHVLEAENGNAALNLAASHPETIHLVVTDVVMPGLNGHELAQKILASRPGIKVLYLSGYAEDAINASAAARQQKAFLQKPFTLQALTRKVREVLGPASSAKSASS
jgi:two-component system, cell cycle sensor histidine kinase and response regulator CckA